ncbi:hypothetical protein LTR53_016003 [Teratosphaeriaceae sp. CCFEE 6253]|nr:hypothetical protein LTR53_016003 [Teratosphaeriaceae sp. CCFEE 6253]
MGKRPLGEAGSGKATQNAECNSGRVTDRPCKWQRLRVSSSQSESLPQRSTGHLSTPHNSETADSDVAGYETAPSPSRRTTKQRALDYVAVHGPAYPISSYRSDTTPAASISEADAVRRIRTQQDRLKARAGSEPEPDFVYFQLNDFSIYRPVDRGTKDRHGGELVTLDRLLQSHDHSDFFLVNGTLSCGGGEGFPIRGVKFNTLAIDGYEDSSTFSVENKISIQSRGLSLSDLWYQLGTPSAEYRRFYKPFVWLAHFAQCFVEYLLETEAVDLRHFVRDAQFVSWLQARYGDFAEFHAWIDEAGLHDYRTTVAANVGFLHKEAYSIDSELVRHHPVWGEVDPLNLTAIPSQPNVQKQTVVTPFAHNMFRRMYFGSQLEELAVENSEVYARAAERKRVLGLTPLDSLRQRNVVPVVRSVKSITASTSSSPAICSGDVITIAADAADVSWKASGNTWYAYVQAVRGTQRGKVLDVLWLYRTSDTTLGRAYYPFPQELFISDNCACGKEAIPIDAVISKVEIEWHVTDPAAVSGLFVRQKFCTVAAEDRYSFETLKTSDFRCQCRASASEWDDCLRDYKVHDTVLVIRYRLEDSAGGITLLGRTYLPGCELDVDVNESVLHKLDGKLKGWLDPAEIVGFNHGLKTVVLRPFDRAGQTTTAPPNELHPSETLIELPVARLVRRCHIRCFEDCEIRKGLVPAPYDRKSTGDCYIVRTESKNAMTFSQGFDPALGVSKLRGMGIFCGGGNLDRGLEDGGAVEFDFAVDWAEHALHSYRAASRNPDAQYFLGSVNDYLAAAIRGSDDRRMAKIGAVDIIAGGSPCPGYSLLNNSKQSVESLRNASMVASVVAYVDLYSPKYFVLENVVTMTQGMGVNKDENVFSQVLAALVALGYQVQQFLMDSWSYGSCQQRSRVFIIASAPNTAPLNAPPHTHGHPDYVGFRTRNLGRSSNGLPFGKRRNVYTPFPHVSAAQACDDLPNISDAQARLCVAFPDHRTPTDEGGASRARIAMIPIRPSGMGLVQAVRAGHITSGEPLAYYSALGRLQLTEGSTTYARIHADRLVPTLTTAMRIRDGVAGRTLHWREPRGVTVMECRRTRGYQDDEPLIGSPVQQMKIVGNSVDRCVSLALGMVLRESWRTTQELTGRPAAILATAAPADSGPSNAALNATGLPATPRPEVARASTDTSAADTSASHEPALDTPMTDISATSCTITKQPVPASSTPIQQAERGASTILSAAQVQDIRVNGFKAILQNLGASPWSATNKTP